MKERCSHQFENNDKILKKSGVFWCKHNQSSQRAVGAEIWFAIALSHECAASLDPKGVTPKDSEL